MRNNLFFRQRRCGTIQLWIAPYKSQEHYTSGIGNRKTPSASDHLEVSGTFLFPLNILGGPQKGVLAQ